VILRSVRFGTFYRDGLVTDLIARGHVSMWWTCIPTSAYMSIAAVIGVCEANR